MIQCFVKKEYEPPFGLTRPPRLFSVSRTDAEASAHPRVMHAHDDLVEIVLVRGGESRYFVGGMPYDARRGDLFIYNSRVVHDEPSGPDRPVASFSLALGGLSVPGLRENALIPDDASPVCPLTETQTVRLERLYDVLYSELTAGNDDGAHHLLMALLTLVLDNRRDTLPEAVSFKLDYARNRMQAFIDQMLYYARLRGARRDYRFERLTLRSCIDEVLDDYRPLLEEKGFRVEIRLADETVFTDRRGLCFLLGQLVSNSGKYTSDAPVLTFSLTCNTAETVLTVRDNGPGVRACDLPYVFEKGFTGDSGHEKSKATGMGLYLAREIAKELGLMLSAASDWGAGFAVCISFPVVTQ